MYDYYITYMKRKNLSNKDNLNVYSIIINSSRKKPFATGHFASFGSIPVIHAGTDVTGSVIIIVKKLLKSREPKFSDHNQRHNTLKFDMTPASIVHIY